MNVNSKARALDFYIHSICDIYHIRHKINYIHVIPYSNEKKCTLWKDDQSLDRMIEMARAESDKKQQNENVGPAPPEAIRKAFSWHEDRLSLRYTRTDMIY